MFGPRSVPGGGTRYGVTGGQWSDPETSRAALALRHRVTRPSALVHTAGG